MKKIETCLLALVCVLIFGKPVSNHLTSDIWSSCERKCSERVGIQIKKLNSSNKRYCYDGNYLFQKILITNV